MRPSLGPPLPRLEHCDAWRRAAACDKAARGSAEERWASRVTAELAPRSCASIICVGAVTTGPSTGFEIFVSGRQDCSQSEIPFSGAPISFVAPLHFSSYEAPPNSALERTSARRAGGLFCTSIERAEAAQF